MRSLRQSLLDHELTVLRVLGEWWEMDLTGADKQACVDALTRRFAEIDLEQEMIYMPPEEAEAVRLLMEHDGRLPVSIFSRTYGDLRLMGPGRLEREEPWFDPISVTEALWYRGFLYRAFDETDDGLTEFYYLPTELTDSLAVPFVKEQVIQESQTAYTPITPPSSTESTSRTLSTEPPERYETAVTSCVDDVTAIISQAQVTGLHGEQRWGERLLDDDPTRRALLLTLAKESGLIKADGRGGMKPTRTAVSWLRDGREGQLRLLMEGWSNSNWNELCRTPGLICEGDGWKNDPILARTALLDALPRDGEWFSLAAVTAVIQRENPDFQRPDGKYDTWYIRDSERNLYLNGFEEWAAVEGRLLHYLVQEPMRWLGMVEGDGDVWRLTPRALAWLADLPPAPDVVKVPLVVQKDGILLIPYNADRYHRFQAARIGEAMRVEAGKPFMYRLSPTSLSRAKAEGITPQRILAFLKMASERPLPAGVQRGLERWAERGIEGQLETAVILRVNDAAILNTLRNNPKTRAYFGESLGEFAIMVTDWEKLLSAAAQLGLLIDHG